MAAYSSDINKCENQLVEYIQAYSVSYPINIGRPPATSEEAYNEKVMTGDEKLTLAFYLADKYLLNFESAHCIPLPLAYFVEPWSEKDIKIHSF